MDYSTMCNLCKIKPAELACECEQLITLLDINCAVLHFQDQSRTHKLLELQAAFEILSASNNPIPAPKQESIKSKDSLIHFKDQLSSFRSQFMLSRTKLLDKLEEVTENTLAQLLSITQEIDSHLNIIATNQNSNSSDSFQILQKYSENELGDFLSYYPEYLDILEQNALEHLDSLVYIGTKPLVIPDHGQAYRQTIEKLERKKQSLKDLIQTKELKEQKNAQKFNEINREKFLLASAVKQNEDQIYTLTQDLNHLKRDLTNTQNVITDKDTEIQLLKELIQKLQQENTELKRKPNERYPAPSLAPSDIIKPQEISKLQDLDIHADSISSRLPKIQPIVSIKSCLFCEIECGPEDLVNYKICTCKMCRTCYRLRIDRSILRCELCTLPLTRSQLVKCDMCPRDIISETLPNLSCQHKICIFCLIFHIEAQMQSVSLQIKCPSCPSEIHSDIYSQYISEDVIRTYSENIFKKLDQESPKIQCMNCQAKISESNRVKLECTHIFCKKCLKGSWNYYIKHKTFGCIGLSCLKCSYIIPNIIVKSTVKSDIFEKFIYIIIKRRQRTFYCKLCSIGFTWQGFQMSCPNRLCNAKLCMKCGELKRNCNCRNYERNPNFDSWISKYGACPNCGMMNSKTKGKSEKIVCNNLECGVTYCIRCSRRYEPIIAHGEHYHHPNCINYKISRTTDKYKPDKCLMCKGTGTLCRPG